MNYKGKKLELKMKRNQTNHTEWQHGCPVKCPVCCYNSNVWPARFKHFSLSPSQTVEGISERSNHILFLINGALRIRMEGKDIYIQSRQAIFFGRNTHPRIRVTKESQIVWLEFTNRIVLGTCDVLSKMSGNEIRKDDSLPLLELNENLLLQLRAMTFLDSPCYHLCRQHELYMLLKHTYSEEELAHFFRPLVKAKDDFRAFVVDNYRYGDTVEDAARKANMSPNYFLRKFKETFGMTAYQWLVKQKAERILEAIAAGETDSKHLAQRFGFDSTSALYLFCRRRMGQPLSQIVGKYTIKRS